MARIAGINIPQNKLVQIGLTYIYGIGDKFSKQICSSLEIPKNKRVNQLTDDEILKIREYIDQNFKVEGDLRRDYSLSIKRLIDLACYRVVVTEKNYLLEDKEADVCKNKKRESYCYSWKKINSLKNNYGKKRKSRSKDQKIEKSSKKLSKSSYSKKKKVKKNILNGIAYVQSTFNNTIISIADINGNVISWVPWSKRF